MIVHYTQLGKVREENPSKKLVFFDGTFELLNTGHIELVKNLHLFGDVIVVGVLSDEWIWRRKKHKRPFVPGEDRLVVADAIKYIDYATLLDDKGQKRRVKTSEALDILRPDVYVSYDDLWVEREKELNDRGIQLRLYPRDFPPPSTPVKPGFTTALVERILAAHGCEKEALEQVPKPEEEHGDKKSRIYYE